jgi:SAM-dependent methyltransferase
MATEDEQDEGQAPIDLHTDRPHPARVYDYLLGGKTHFAADRESGERGLAAAPQMRDTVKANRAFLVRAVRFLAEQGVRQFLDIGTGIPTSPNVHETAQKVAPDSRVVYVDNDPIVLQHARALMAGPGRGETRIVQADLRDPQAVLNHPDLAKLIDFDQPVAVLLVAVLHLMADDDDPAGIVAQLLAPMCSGSYLALSHLGRDFNEERQMAVSASAARDNITLIPRWRDEILGWVDGLDLVEPGLVQVVTWRPDGEVSAEERARVWTYAGVARKP